MALVAAGCGSDQAVPSSSALRAVGPPNVVRIALSDFRWPLDPALAAGRDELTLARALYSTPLRTDPSTGAVVPGLCTAWTASDDFRRWTFTCRSAPAIAAALRRVKHLDGAPARWLFADAAVSAPSASRLDVRLAYPWRRFPYALTVVGAAPRFVPGPFRLVSGSQRLVVLRREGLTLQVQRLPALAAMRKFERGELDEAPVPVGDIVAARADSQLRASVRARTLLGIDHADIAGWSERFRRVYWETANRRDYEQLIPELEGSSAYGFLGGEQARPADFRRAVDAIPSLRKLPLWFFVPPDPALREGARLLYAQWRDLGLGPILLRSGPEAKVECGHRADNRRLSAGRGDSGRARAAATSLVRATLLLGALSATSQRPELQRLDDQMRRRASAIPIAWVVDARLVSPRLEGWREDVLGNVDYSVVKSLASSRPR